MMNNYELRTGMSPGAASRNNGRFAKGNRPWNKGRKWDEYLDPETQRKLIEVGTRNLKPTMKGHKPTRACPVISIDAEGKMRRHETITYAARHFGINRENLGRCARLNHAMRPSKKNGKVNTNHRCKGIRFYLEDDVLLWSNARRNE